MAFHSQVVWGSRVAPAIAVRPLDHVHERVLRSPWRTTDGIPSWSWPGFEGTGTEVVVFSPSDEVELLLNGRSLGRSPAGRANNCLATCEAVYEPGELTAVARTSTGVEVSRSRLVSSGSDVALRLTCDRTELSGDGQDLAFVEVELIDGAGIVVALSGVALRAQVTGDGTLAGFGSADPKPADSYTAGMHRTYYGRALAVVRAGLSVGNAQLTVSADGYPDRHHCGCPVVHSHPSL